MADETEVASRQRGSRVGKRKITIRVACSRHSTRVVCGIHGFALRNVLSLLYHWNYRLITHTREFRARGRGQTTKKDKIFFAAALVNGGEWKTRLNEREENSFRRNVPENVQTNFYTPLRERIFHDSIR